VFRFFRFFVFQLLPYATNHPSTTTTRRSSNQQFSLPPHTSTCLDFEKALCTTDGQEHPQVVTSEILEKFAHFTGVKILSFEVWGLEFRTLWKE
jgi:hypothetical protein